MPLRIDCHLHLAATGCNCTSNMASPSFLSRYTIFLLRKFHGISKKELTSNFDLNWAQKMSTTISESLVDYGVALGFDGVVLDGNTDYNRSQMIVANEWVFECCRKYPNLLPGPSINPHRKNAIELLDYCIENKAVLIKWLPSAQLIDASQPALIPFYKKLADAKIPLLIHCGPERTFKSLDPKLNEVEQLKLPLEQGVKVICAHSGTNVLGSREPDQSKILKSFLSTYQNLWLDNSGLCNPSRFFHLPKLAQDQTLTERTLYGSDWPVPVNAFYYLKDLGYKKTLELEREKNWISRDIKIKKHFGYSDMMFTNNLEVLGNLPHWIPALS